MNTEAEELRNSKRVFLKCSIFVHDDSYFVLSFFLLFLLFNLSPAVQIYASRIHIHLKILLTGHGVRENVI